MSPTTPERQYTVEQVANLLNVDPETIRRAIRRGEIKTPRNTLEPGAPYYIAASELEAWKARRIS